MLGQELRDNLSCQEGSTLYRDFRKFSSGKEKIRETVQNKKYFFILAQIIGLVEYQEAEGLRQEMSGIENILNFYYVTK